VEPDALEVRRLLPRNQPPNIYLDKAGGLLEESGKSAACAPYQLSEPAHEGPLSNFAPKGAKPGVLGPRRHSLKTYYQKHCNNWRLEMNVFINSLLIFSFCIACEDPPPPKYFLNEHYLVIDFLSNGSCDNNVTIFYQNTPLSFSFFWNCNATYSSIACPDMLLATNFSTCVNNWGNCSFLDRGFLLLDNCRLLIDVDAVKARYSTSESERRKQVTNQPLSDFHLFLTINSVELSSSATIDATLSGVMVIEQV
jgi:hypothetical protein